MQTGPDQSGLILVEFHGIKHPARSTYIERFPIPVARNNCGRQRRMGTYPNTCSGIPIANSGKTLYSRSRNEWHQDASNTVPKAARKSRLKAYVVYFNQAQPHQGLGQRIPDPLLPFAPLTNEPNKVIAVPIVWPAPQYRLQGVWQRFQRFWATKARELTMPGFMI